ncbi:hypothetical protein SAMN05444164_3966 [Bradyrhizobium erythrophlei]|uniref:Uncharacterized protein n=2 Tax=Bradyrhizobium erythrophlei TaxID=1437360 RepID=A0A1H4YIB6_9BRAD|nr:hypothetical protein SAMN05444164_3966 [Bradyrhizobium erythrophlei]
MVEQGTHTRFVKQALGRNQQKSGELRAAAKKEEQREQHDGEMKQALQHRATENAGPHRDAFNVEVTKPLAHRKLRKP